VRLFLSLSLSFSLCFSRNKGAIQAEVPFYRAEAKGACERKKKQELRAAILAPQKKQGELSRFACGALANPQADEPIGKKYRLLATHGRLVRQ